MTKSGEVAGPKVVEHMVDAVLYLEGGDYGRGSGGEGGVRVLRARKNRFGSSDECGVFRMGEEGGMEPVEDPSEMFLRQRETMEDVEGK